MYFGGGKKNLFFFRNAYTGAGRCRLSVKALEYYQRPRDFFFFGKRLTRETAFAAKREREAQKEHKQTCDLGTTYTHTYTYTGFDEDPLPSLPSPSAIGKSGSVDLGYVTLCLFRPRGFENLA
jgi:hypothetical protein